MYNSISIPLKTLSMIFCLISLQALSQTKEVELGDNYFYKKDYEKAAILYDKAAKKAENVPFIYDSYRTTLIHLKSFKELDKWIGSLRKRYPQELKYTIDGYLNNRSLGKKDWQKDIEKLRVSLRSDNINVRVASEHLQRRGETQFAISYLTYSRDHLGNSNLYTKDLAQLYLYANNKKGMINEYLQHLITHQREIEDIQYIFQTELDEKELDILIDQLYQRVSRDKEPILNQLLVWAYIQQKDFYNAFIQERAIDIKQNLYGTRLNDLAKITLKNSDYNTALEIYKYLCDTYPNHPNYFTYKKSFINTQELVLLSTYPIDSLSVVNLIDNYEDLKNNSFNQTLKAEVTQNQARLFAFYLNNIDSAIVLLENSSKWNRVSNSVRSESKLQLADIYLLQDDPRASLLYFQVEKEQDDNTVGHLAKLKNAKYWYYNGDFELAKSQLDVLKLATSREIANDAIEMSVLIQDNLGLDTSETALRIYAKAELYFFQHKYEWCQIALDSLGRNFPNHTLADEMIWLQSKLAGLKGDYTEVISLYDKIINEHPKSIKIDDAKFSKAQALEQKLGDKKQAMEIYKDILINHRNSIYVAEARKRYRILRGDILN